MSAPGNQRRTSTKDDYETPDEVYDPLNDEFHFTIDVCADEDNHKCEAYYSIEEDGLFYEWSGVCWLNPPYSNTKAWLLHASKQRCTSIALVPNSTENTWFHEIAWPTPSVLPRRISFLQDGVPQKGNTGGSIIVIWQYRQNQLPLQLGHSPQVSVWDYR